MTTKTFDCVEMKHEIQQALRERFRNVSWAERNQVIRGQVAKDTHLCRLLQEEITTQASEAGESE